MSPKGDLLQLGQTRHPRGVRLSSLPPQTQDPSQQWISRDSSVCSWRRCSLAEMVAWQRCPVNTAITSYVPCVFAQAGVAGSRAPGDRSGTIQGEESGHRAHPTPCPGIILENSQQPPCCGTAAAQPLLGTGCQHGGQRHAMAGPWPLSCSGTWRWQRRHR